MFDNESKLTRCQCESERSRVSVDTPLRVLTASLVLLGASVGNISLAQQSASPPPAALASEEKTVTTKPASGDEADKAREKIRRERAVRLTALLQTWYGNGLGNTLGGNAPGMAPPQGRNYGTGGKDELRFRRAQIALSGSPTSQFDYRVMLNFARPDLLQDAWVGYQAGHHVHIEAGRQKTGLSEEGSRPGSQLLTIARSTMNEDLPVKAGRVGAVRATGVAVRYEFAAIHGFVGVWNSLGDTSGLALTSSRKFADGALYLDAIPNLTLGVWGGTAFGGRGAVENRSRAGGAMIYRSGRVFMEAELAYTRDYAAGAPAPGKNGSLGRGGYFLASYRIAPPWQLVFRFENWDPAQQGIFTGVAVTESGVAIPPSNHKLREYTLGVNYEFPSRDARLQFNYIREDVEEHGGPFFGVPRNLVLLNLQLGYDSLSLPKTRPEDYGRHETSNKKIFPLQNALRIGLLYTPAVGHGSAIAVLPPPGTPLKKVRNPTLGLALGMEVGLPTLKLLPRAYSRLSADVMAPFDVPSFLGFPHTSASFTLDQVFLHGTHGGQGFYGGFGVGGSYAVYSGLDGKLFIGDNLSSRLGIELSVHFNRLPEPHVNLQMRLPL